MTQRSHRSTPRRTSSAARTTALLAAALVMVALIPGHALAAPGDLDPVFDTDGRVTTPFPNGALANAVAIQRDRKIVVAGESNGRFAVARYNTDGSLDTTFSGDGKLTTPFAGDGAMARALAIQADGKIVVAGQSDLFERIAVARYETDGSLDTTFSGNGKLTMRIRSGDNFARAVAVQTDGRILLAGSTSGGRRSAAVVVRLRATGDLDPTFGRHGVVTTGCGNDVGDAYGLAIQPNGRIVAVGEGVVAGGFCVARYRADGRLDRSFSRDGIVISRFPGGARAVALQPDGKIVVGGIGGDIFGPFAVARYLSDGRLDHGFGNHGHRNVAMGDGEESGEAIVIASDGKIVEVGYTNVPHEFGDPGNGAFALVRFRPGGKVDRSFGDRGKVLTEFPEGLALGMGAALQRNGKIVAAGWAGGRFGLARYLAS